MWNGRSTLSGILAICLAFSIISAALSQTTSSGADTTADNSALSQSQVSQSQVIEIIKEIHASETRIRDHVDKKSSELNTKFSELDKDVAVLKERVDRIENDLQRMLNWIIGGVVTLIISVVGHFTKPWWEKRVPWRNRDKIQTIPGPRRGPAENEQLLSSELTGERS